MSKVSKFEVIGSRLDLFVVVGLMKFKLKKNLTWCSKSELRDTSVFALQVFLYSAKCHHVQSLSTWQRKYTDVKMS